MKREFYDLAVISANIAGTPINPKFIYAQWAHETNDFSSTLCLVHHNLAGLTQTIPNDLPQPDGSLFYADFPSYLACAEYFGRYLRLYRADGIYQAKTLKQYVIALKNGGYFGDSVENYLKGCKFYVKQIQNV